MVTCELRPRRRVSRVTDAGAAGEGASVRGASDVCSLHAAPAEHAAVLTAQDAVGEATRVFLRGP
jgi:hypothetical protein